MGYYTTGYNSPVPFLAVCRVLLHKTHETPASVKILLTIYMIEKNCDESESVLLSINSFTTHFMAGLRFVGVTRLVLFATAWKPTLG